MKAIFTFVLYLWLYYLVILIEVLFWVFHNIGETLFPRLPVLLLCCLLDKVHWYHHQETLVEKSHEAIAGVQECKHEVDAKSLQELSSIEMQQMNKKSFIIKETWQFMIHSAFTN